MDFPQLNFSSIFVLLFHFSNLMAFLAFLLRDQLQLRLLMGISLFLQALYYYAIPGGPFFDPLFWKVVSFVANAVMIVLVFGGSLDFGIPEDLRSLFDKMAVLTPGQFRKLTARTVRVHGGGAAILTEGMKPDRLYYLLKGEAQIIKNRQTANLQAGAFLGEIAFLSDLPATATVVLNQGAECIAWNRAALLQTMKKDAALDIAMRGFFNHDPAYKVARSVPITPPPEPPRRPKAEQ
ncbi:MAG: cyclic nucleotide-binding domain-containing protein [Phyllobacteriaceae bacterium]|nr:cyclic nucleotide-binding domain-containing protein [Phyllobacteriaceae bacterium]